MSKNKSKGKKKSNTKNQSRVLTPQRKNLKIIISIVALIIVIAIVGIIIFFKSSSSDSKMLTENTWTPVSAHNASNDEVELSEIYNTVYSSYSGSLKFNDDNTFSFWLTPGDATDGTHSGKYTYDGGTEISIYFDDGTETIFEVVKNSDGSIQNIKCNYDDYVVYFGLNS